MAKEPKTALELASMIRGHVGEKDLKIGVFYDRANGWRAVAYTSPDTVAIRQAQVRIVQEMREWFTLGEN